MNIIEFIESRLDLNREEVQVKGHPVPIIELNEDAKSVVTNADKGLAHLTAVCYGLRSGIKSVMSKKEYKLEDMKEVVSEFFTHEEIEKVAEEIFLISEYELPEYIEDTDPEEDEDVEHVNPQPPGY